MSFVGAGLFEEPNRVATNFFAVVPLLAVSWHLEEPKGAATAKKSAVGALWRLKSQKGHYSKNPL